MTHFEKILTRLDQEHVEYILIGGLAAIAQGCTFSTSDLDLVYKRTPENIKKILRALSPLHVKLRGKDLPDNLPFIFDERSFKDIHNFTLLTDLGPVDLLDGIPGFNSYEELLNSSDILDLFGVQLRILSIEGLIKNKKIVQRTKDQNHIAELEELLKLKKEGNR